LFFVFFFSPINVLILEVCTHPFWTSPAPFWELPKDLAESWKEADLIFLKGDANYR
jgi:hypothetical protein